MSNREFDLLMRLMLTLIEEKKYDKLEELIRDSIDNGKKE